MVMILFPLFEIQIILKFISKLYMNINNEELETFLVEVELINQKVKALA